MSEQSPTPGPQVPMSLRDELRAQRQAALRREPKDFAIPGYGGRLWGTFRPLEEYAEIREIVKRYESVGDDAERETLMAAAQLALSCVKTFYMRDGQRKPLEIPDTGLTPALVRYLLDENVDNDVQAVYMLLPTTRDIVEFYGEIETAFKAIRQQVDKELEGNFVAPR